MGIALVLGYYMYLEQYIYARLHMQLVNVLVEDHMHVYRFLL